MCGWQSKFRESLPEEWDLESTSSLESNLYTLNENLRTISHLITKVGLIFFRLFTMGKES